MYREFAVESELEANRVVFTNSDVVLLTFVIFSRRICGICSSCLWLVSSCSYSWLSQSEE